MSYWNFSQRVDLNISDNLKVFARAGVFKADLYQDNPLATGGGFFPLSGSNRDGLSIAGDAVWLLSEKTTLNVRGSFYNMIDEFYNPALLLGSEGLACVLAERLVLVALQQRLRLLSGARRHLGHRHQRQQPARAAGPRVVPASRRLDAVGPHEPLPGRAQPEVGRRDARLLRRGGPLRADQPRLQLDADRQQLRQPAGRHHRQPVGDVPARRAGQQHLGAAGAAADDQPARLLGLLPGRLEGRRAADGEPRHPVGVRARRDRSGQPAVAGPRPHAAHSRDAGDAAQHAGPGRAADGRQGLRVDLQRRLAVRDRGQPQLLEHQLEEHHAARRHQLPAGRRRGHPLRLRPLHDADQQRPRHARRLRQPVRRLRADDEHAQPGQRAAAAGARGSVPGQQPGPAADRPVARALHRPRRRGQLRRIRAASADQRSLPRVLPEGPVEGHRLRHRLLLQPGIARALHAQPQHARPVLHLRVRRAAQHAGRQPVPQLPDAGAVPGPAAQQRHRSPSAACWCRTRSTGPSSRRTPASAAT